MLDNILNLSDDIKTALLQTAFMVFTSLAAAIVIGGALGLLLYATSNQLFIKNQAVNHQSICFWIYGLFSFR